MKPVEERHGETGNLSGRLRAALGLERNVVVMSVAVFLLGAGEELWKSFLPKYLEALGAGAAVIGMFGTSRDFLDAIYQYPGGYISDRIGTQKALTLFAALAALGYGIYALSARWYFVFLGLVLSMAWTSMASPAMFAMIAERLPPNRRAMGFTVQSILKRVPIILSPAIGGLLIARYGLIKGIRISLVITIILSVFAILAQRRFYFASEDKTKPAPIKLRAQFGAMHGALKRLLISDIFIRTCEAIVNVFVVLYVTDVVGATSLQFGLLAGIQMSVSVAAYIPAGKLADRFGRKPFVVATFICFSLFPLAVVLSRSFAALVVAFVIGGLRELGEPARKSMIVDLADPTRRGRTVGLYYLTRSLAITPASLTGGYLWKFSPTVPFFVACLIGLIGTAIFIITVDRRYAT
ncbi:MAG TPA: MFS transporter [Blastocatellia bacterium]|nr:MFS transporter [Blastocatellia bacterium]